MSDHFNRLTPAEAERLAMLAEEAGEIVQAVGKILRHGFDSYHPENPQTTNRMLLEGEINDLYAVVGLLAVAGDIQDCSALDEHISKKLRFAHHQ